MTNAEIISTAMALNDVDFDLEVDTFAGWKRRGYAVKKGEHAVFTTKIWKPSKFKVEQKEQDFVDENGEQVVEDAKYTKKLILVNAAFFTENQVQRAVAVG